MDQHHLCFALSSSLVYSTAFGNSDAASWPYIFTYYHWKELCYVNPPSPGFLAVFVHVNNNIVYLGSNVRRSQFLVLKRLHRLLQPMSSYCHYSHTCLRYTFSRGSQSKRFPPKMLLWPFSLFYLILLELLFNSMVFITSWFHIFSHWLLPYKINNHFFHLWCMCGGSVWICM